MTATERYETSWNAYLKELNRHPTTRLATFLKSRHINSHGMDMWMHRHGLSVSEAKRRIKEAHKKSKEDQMPPSSESTGMMFMPVDGTALQNMPDNEDVLSGISFTFPDGTLASIKKGSA